MRAWSKLNALLPPKILPPVTISANQSPQMHFRVLNSETPSYQSQVATLFSFALAFTFRQILL